MTTRYYVEVDVDPVDPSRFVDLKSVLKKMIDELTWDMEPEEVSKLAMCHGYTDVYTTHGTKGAHAEIVKAVGTLIPDAHVSTRWICWEELAFDAEHNTEEEEG